MSVEELESVVSALPPAELARFSQWFEEFIAEQWDRQIEEDMQAGRLDAALKRADEHYQAGRCTPTTSPTPTSGFTTADSPTISAPCADKNFALLKRDPRHSSIRLKKIGVLYAARIGLHYRALTRERIDGLQWFWIGHHSIYDQLLRS